MHYYRYMTNSKDYVGPDYSIRYGSKHDKNLDIKDIAKLVRKDIKSNIKGNFLPNLKVSVKISRYSGGQSLRVSVNEFSGKVLNPAHSPNQWGSQRYTDEAAHVLEVIRHIVSSYNYDGSDSQSDYFNVNFYGSVDFSMEIQDAERSSAKELEITDAHTNFLAAIGC